MQKPGKIPDINLPVQWRFALDQAFQGLRKLVYSFDFIRLANGHTYTGIKPDYLIEVIDGFLGESDDIIFSGDLTNLQHMRNALVTRILPTYEKGLTAGRRLWRNGDGVYGSITTEELHKLALQSLLDDDVQGWFAEGFCYGYAIEEFDSLCRND